MWHRITTGTGQSEPLRDDATVVESPFIAPFRLPLDDQLRQHRRHSVLSLLNGGRALDDNGRPEEVSHGFVMGEWHEEEGMTSMLRKLAYVQLVAAAMIVLLPVVAIWRARRRRRDGREREMEDEEERRHARDWNRQA